VQRALYHRGVTHTVLTNCLPPTGPGFLSSGHHERTKGTAHHQPQGPHDQSRRDAIYGTFAEIGAGQEVARVFFQAGGASGTVAKTISAYDMAFSDAIYGKAPSLCVARTPRPHARPRVQPVDRAPRRQPRADRTTFFVFADTVAAKRFKGTNDAHGWMGVRFQLEPGGEPSDDRPARAHVGQGKRPPAGGPRHRRHQPDLRRPSTTATIRGQVHRVARRQPQHRRASRSTC
jgi:hypothetical protein